MTTLRLPVLARNELRSKLRSHPDISRYVSTASKVNSMAKSELLALAARLRIDVKEIIRQTQKEGRGLEAVMEEDDLERFRYSEEHPAFHGTIDFDLSISLLGNTVVRKARIEWEHTPEWPHFDLNKKQVVEGWAGDAFSINVLAVPEGERWEKGPNGKVRKAKNVPVWIRMGDLIQEGVLPDSIIDEIDRRIEETCQAEDAQRRAEHLGSDPLHRQAVNTDAPSATSCTDC